VVAWAWRTGGSMKVRFFGFSHALSPPSSTATKSSDVCKEETQHNGETVLTVV